GVRFWFCINGTKTREQRLPGREGFTLLRQRGGFGVLRGQAATARIEGPAGVMVDFVRGEGELDTPTAIGFAPTVPTLVSRGKGFQSLCDSAAEGDRGRQ